VLLLAVTLTLVPLKVAGLPYLVVAVLLGGAMIAIAVRGFVPGAQAKWARQLFAASLVYLPLLFAALALDALV
jgi:protoheme IX farnesyltransferase